MNNFKTKVQAQSGFSLIEMIVSLGVFSVIITISMGALLMIISSSQQLQKEQNVMTNLSFALDSMTREIRTGSKYYCQTRNSNNNNMFDDSKDLDVYGSGHPFGSYDDVLDCADGRIPDNHRYQGIAFVESGQSITGTGDRILYYFDSDLNKIFRRVGDGASLPITSSGINIIDAEFFVTGSESLSNNVAEVDQALVTIIIKARDINDAGGKIYRIQTSITQRTLDI